MFVIALNCLNDANIHATHTELTQRNNDDNKW